MILLHIFTFLLGAALVAATAYSAVATFVVPRNAASRLTRVVFLLTRRLFLLRLRGIEDYRRRDRLMAFYAPVSLVALVPTWAALTIAGYTLMFWSLGDESLFAAFRDAGSSLLTLGFEPLEGLFQTVLGFSAATIGLMVAALLISYLPTIYAAFSRRETAVTLLEVRAGTPPSAVEMLQRYNRIHGLDQLGDQWRTWETWFADIEESHTSLAALVFFRSPQPEHSWITAAGAVLDAAALTLAAVDIPFDPQAALCLRAGYLALRHIGGFFDIAFNPDPHHPDDPISVTRAEFDAALEQLAASGVPLKTDQERAWLDFAGWRVNYDRILLALCSLTMAPIAPWSSDRAPAFKAPPLFPAKGHPRITSE
jgi:hypothetical protein